MSASQPLRTYNVSAGAARGDGRATLTLDGGLTAPVSRRYARTLREAGWY